MCACIHVCMFKHGHVCSGLFSTVPVVLLETNHFQYCFLIVLMFLFLFSFLVTWKKCWIWVWLARMHLTWWWSAIAARSGCSTDSPWSVRSWQDTQIPLWQSAPVPRKTSLSLHLRCVGLKQNCIVVVWFLFLSTESCNTVSALFLLLSSFVHACLRACVCVSFKLWWYLQYVLNSLFLHVSVIQMKLWLYAAGQQGEGLENGPRNIRSELCGCWRRSCQGCQHCCLLSVSCVWFSSFSRPPLQARDQNSCIL